MCFQNDRNVAFLMISFLCVLWNRNETADGYMRLYSEDNKKVTEAVYGRKYKLRVGVNNLDSKGLPFPSSYCHIR